MSRGRMALIAAALVLAAASGWAQVPAKQEPPRKAISAPARAPAKPSPRAAPITAPPAATGRGEAKTTAAPVESDGGVKVVERGDGGAKQFRFTETEVEGRLKAPQLVYFLRRVRAEFSAGDLGHRSFMRELSDTQRDDSF